MPEKPSEPPIPAPEPQPAPAEPQCEKGIWDAGWMAGLAEGRAELAARIATLEQALRETLPRYIELFEAAGLGNPDDSVAVQLMRAALAERPRQGERQTAEQVMKGWALTDEEIQDINGLPRPRQGEEPSR